MNNNQQTQKQSNADKQQKADDFDKEKSAVHANDDDAKTDDKSQEERDILSRQKDSD